MDNNIRSKIDRLRAERDIAESNLSKNLKQTDFRSILQNETSGIIQNGVNSILNSGQNISNSTSSKLNVANINSSNSTQMLQNNHLNSILVWGLSKALKSKKFSGKQNPNTLTAIVSKILSILR